MKRNAATSAELHSPSLFAKPAVTRVKRCSRQVRSYLIRCPSSSISFFLILVEEILTPSSASTSGTINIATGFRSFFIPRFCPWKTLRSHNNRIHTRVVSKRSIGVKKRKYLPFPVRIFLFQIRFYNIPSFYIIVIWSFSKQFRKLVRNNTYQYSLPPSKAFIKQGPVSLMKVVKSSSQRNNLVFSSTVWVACFFHFEIFSLYL